MQIRKIVLKILQLILETFDDTFPQKLSNSDRGLLNFILWLDTYILGRLKLSEMTPMLYDDYERNYTDDIILYSETVQIYWHCGKPCSAELCWCTFSFTSVKLFFDKTQTLESVSELQNIPVVYYSAANDIVGNTVSRLQSSFKTRTHDCCFSFAIAAAKRTLRVAQTTENNNTLRIKIRANLGAKKRTGERNIPNELRRYQRAWQRYFCCSEFQG